MTINKIIKKIIGNFNFSVSKKINNVKFKIPLLNAVGTLNIRSDEQWMSQVMRQFLTPGSIFIDVGANIGQTLLKVKSIDRDIPYYGFEPNPVCNYYLQQLIRGNKFSNCHVYPIGLGVDIDIKEFFIFFEGDISSASGSTIVDLIADKPVYTELIPVFNLDYFKDRVFSQKKIDLIKIDVENGELEVLKGGLGTFEKFKPIIITEILPLINANTIDKTNSRKAEMQKIMAGIHYNFYKVIIDEKQEFKGLKPVNDLVTESGESKLHYDFNYMIIPGEKDHLINNFIIG